MKIVEELNTSEIGYINHIFSKATYDSLFFIALMCVSFQKRLLNLFDLKGVVMSLDIDFATLLYLM